MITLNSMCVYVNNQETVDYALQ